MNLTKEQTPMHILSMEDNLDMFVRISGNGGSKRIYS